MKKILLVLIVFPSLVQAAENCYHVFYMEKKAGVVREFSARVKGDEIFLDKLVGFSSKEILNKPPWYLRGFSPMEETVFMEIEGLPSLPLQRKIVSKKELSILGEPLIWLQTELSLGAKEEIIPLNEEETKQNKLLKPFGMREIHLQGRSEVWVRAKQKIAVAEKWVLSGEVIWENKKEPVQIEWARGLQQ